MVARLSSLSKIYLIMLALSTGLHASDCPDRKFSIIAMTGSGYGSASTTYQASMDPGDGGKKYAEVSSCKLGKFGKGCTWLNDDTSKLGDYTVEHSAYEAHTANALDVTVSGNDCDDQVQKCKGGTSRFVDPESGTLFFTSTTTCQEGEAPATVETYSVEELAALADMLPKNETGSEAKMQRSAKFRAMVLS